MCLHFPFSKKKKQAIPIGFCLFRWLCVCICTPLGAQRRYAANGVQYTDFVPFTEFSIFNEQWQQQQHRQQTRRVRLLNSKIIENLPSSANSQHRNHNCQRTFPNLIRGKHVHYFIRSHELSKRRQLNLIEIALQYHSKGLTTGSDPLNSKVDSPKFDQF